MKRFASLLFAPLLLIGCNDLAPDTWSLRVQLADGRWNTMASGISEDRCDELATPLIGRADLVVIECTREGQS